MYASKSQHAKKNLGKILQQYELLAPLTIVESGIGNQISPAQTMRYIQPLLATIYP